MLNPTKARGIFGLLLWLSMTIMPVRAQDSETGSVPWSAAGTVGKRQDQNAVDGQGRPLDRINSRIANRVRSRIDNRIDDTYRPQKSATSAFEAAGNAVRADGTK